MNTHTFRFFIGQMLQSVEPPKMCVRRRDDRSTHENACNEYAYNLRCPFATALLPATNASEIDNSAIRIARPTFTRRQAINNSQNNWNRRNIVVCHRAPAQCRITFAISRANTLTATPSCDYSPSIICFSSFTVVVSLASVKIVAFFRLIIRKTS